MKKSDHFRIKRKVRGTITATADAPLHFQQICLAEPGRPSPEKRWRALLSRLEARPAHACHAHADMKLFCLSSRAFWGPARNARHEPDKFAQRQRPLAETNR